MRARRTLTHLLTAVAVILAVLVHASPVSAAGRGGLDATFGKSGTGIVRTDFGAHEQPTDMWSRPDGSVLVSGTRSARPGGEVDRVVLASYLRSGAPDPGFGRGGKVVLGARNPGGPPLVPPVQRGRTWSAFTAPADRGGTLVVDEGPGGDGFRVRRLKRDGSIDASFGRRGAIVQRSFAATAVAAQPDGRVVVAAVNGAGVVFFGPTVLTGVLLRYDTDGNLDDTFGVGGVVALPPLVAPGGGTYVRALRVSPSGRIVAAGDLLRPDVEFDVFVARFRTDGSLDTAFGPGGVAVADFGGWDWFGDAQLDGEAVLVVADTFSRFIPPSLREHPWGFGVARFTSRGRPDTTFGRAGKVERTYGDEVVSVGNLAVGEAGRSYVSLTFGGYWAPEPGNPCGRACPRGAVTAFDRAGADRRDFGTRGRAWVPTHDATAVIVTRDGVSVAGTLSSERTGFDFGLVRLRD